MNLRDFHYFTAVAEYRHFGRAASACNVSQPALSMQLKKLEESLGVQLFERGNKSVRITPVGEQILAGAKKLLREVDALQEIARTHQDPLAGELRLGAFPTLAPYYLPKIMPSLHRKFPRLAFLLIEEKTNALLEMLKNGKLDAAFIALPVTDAELESHPLFDDPFLLAAPKKHPIGKRKSVTLNDVREQHLLLLEEGHCLRAQVLEVCDLITRTEQKEFRATSLETLRQMVAGGSGVTLIPKIAANKDRNITYLPFKGDAPARTIGLVWRKSSPRAECLQQIVVMLRR